MAEITGIPYKTIIIAASLGAVLYYVTMLIIVHLEAKRLRLTGMPEDQVPCWKDVMKDIHLLLPLVLLFSLLMIGFSPSYSAIWAIGAAVLVTWVRPKTAIGPKQIFMALSEAGSLIAIVALAVAAAGMIVAGLTTTGLVIAIGNIINGVAGWRTLDRSRDGGYRQHFPRHGRSYYACLFDCFGHRGTNPDPARCTNAWLASLCFLLRHSG